MFGLAISLGKTKSLLLSPPNYPCCLLSIKFVVMNADNFKYLDNVISNDSTIDTEIEVSIQKTSHALGIQHTQVLHIRLLTKIKVNIVVPVVLTSLM